MASLVFCEDDESIRRLIRASLRRTPHAVHFAANGVEGLALVERLRPAAVFTDLLMPEMDGLRLCLELKARPHLAAIPRVVVTAITQRDDLADVHASGATAILLKPFSPAALREMVERVLAGTP